MNRTILIAIVGIVIVVGIVALFMFSQNNKSAQNNNPGPSVAAVNPNEEIATVVLGPSGFAPATLTIKAGTRVTWINKSGTSAILASNNHPTHTLYPPLNLGEFGDGSSVQLVFDKPGTYGYHNHLNPDEGGTIVVQ